MPSPSFEFLDEIRAVKVIGMTVPAGTTNGGWILLGSTSSDLGPCCGACKSTAAKTINPIMQRLLSKHDIQTQTPTTGKCLKMKAGIYAVRPRPCRER